MQKKLAFLFTIFILIQSSVSAIERRTEQFPTDFGYLALPLPYIIPGAGSGFGLLGGFNNVQFGGTETTLDLFAIAIAGDIGGNILLATDIPVIPKTFLLDFGQGNFDKGSFRSYRNRRMNSDPDDYVISELSDTKFKFARLTLTLFDRMFDIFGFQTKNESTLSAIRDKDGELIYEANQSFEGVSSSYGFQIDWTDDRTDPQKGLKLIYTTSDSPARNSDSPDYFVQNYNLTSYIPVLSYSTVALNWYRSDATVRKQGNTDLDYLIAKETATCFSNCDPETINVLAKNRQATNTYGSGGNLGGTERLRSYVGGRYSGAHVESRGAEFRWNLSDEKTAFDWYFIKDIRTGFQLAFFYEEGTVADKASELWQEKRTSAGVGTRVVTSSGFVYRLDFATGQEGGSTIIIFDYPWGTFGQ
ncbi:uncharacterized protein METZ01_LOCUS12612 [marine metagenome]|uniref:Bacterial surface antigen (D15) domain-containing protein n=1 Tax=marine metagenome TaxID=408172 RepID=A0A381P0Q6_9ZZZZ